MSNFVLPITLSQQVRATSVSGEASVSDPGSTGSVYALPLLRNVGASSALALAMETLSGAMPKNVRWTEPRAPEQGVIELGAGRWDLEKTFRLDLSGTGTSRYGLTIRGQGPQSTHLVVNTNASPTNFRGGDGIWRAIHVTNDQDNRTQALTLEKFGLVSYATQGGDGSTPLSDPCRWIELIFALRTRMSDMTMYMRYPTALSMNQYHIAMDSCYYSRLESIYATFFQTSSMGTALDGTSKNRKGGVAFRFKNNNALTCTNLTVNGCNLGFHLINENGIAIYGGATEQHNKSFLFDGNSSGNIVSGHRAEFNQQNSSIPLEATEETYFARFAEGTSDNYVEQYSTSIVPLNLIQDFSWDRTNRVSARGRPQFVRPAPTNLIAGGWTNSYGITEAAGGSAPTLLDPTVTTSVQLTVDGSYNRQRYSQPIAVDPAWGSVWYRVICKRVSGAGMFAPEICAKNGLGNVVVYWSPVHGADGKWLSFSTIPVSGVVWGSGKLTVTTLVPHGLQAGMHITNTAAWGSLASGTSMFVESATEMAFVLIAALGGTIADPGSVTVPTTVSITSEQRRWRFAGDVTSDWREFAGNVPIRVNITTAPTVNGSTQAVINGAQLLGLGTGAKIRLSGFADPRLNVDYTVQAGDVSGNSLTLSGLGALSGLVTTPTGHGADSAGFYGQVGLTELRAMWRFVSSNAGQSSVWLVAGEQIMRGPRWEQE